ncbi:Hypothetical protein RG1141_CH36200 [Neorhizobium galegae bv. officinalis bv. officinalis str. HAMBI 1141]|uniref:Transmembrane protein n=1 Tax=Neorhizobium galegae bv. officinalis bv. officinalis str. HAMBI 1141 TaxID=1028801 RepID=A0A068TC06_NEOGA|nr:Hypothetical protein RG1141_CH36200 [Neorhizobium galegae bv. officinalis bv. officinalis str. HAMBI 1141]
MGSFSIWHWLIVIIWLVVFGWPIAKILRRMGFSGWWAVIAFVPLVNIIGLWVVSVARWPVIDRQ